MTSPFPARKATAALLVGAFALSACGGGNPTGAPSAATGTQAAPSTAASLPPASQPPASDLPASAPPASGGTGADPADDLKIAAPYGFAPLNEQATTLFNQFIQQSLGSLGGVFDVGFRAVSKDGGTQPFGVVVVMSFPGVPMGAEAMLDAAAQGSAGAGGSVEERTISGAPVRIVEQETQVIAMTIVDGELVLAIATSRSEKDTVDIATAIIEAN